MYQLYFSKAGNSTVHSGKSKKPVHSKELPIVVNDERLF